MASTIALLGGESSGKTTLARALSSELSQNAPVATVDEVLRGFVAEHGRPPTAGEQASILDQQIVAERKAQEQLAAQGTGENGIVIADPSVLMTAVYSVVYFDDETLIPQAVEHCRDYDLHVFCLGDFPWVAEPGVRDGADYRDQAESVIKRVVREYSLPVLEVSGSIDQRLNAVLAKLAA